MTGLNSARVMVAGAGALGASIALELAEAGARVVLADPASPGDSASGVAAGLLAPAFEAVLDEGSAAHFPLLRAARGLWPQRAARLGDIGFRRSGAVWIDLPGDAPLIDRHARDLAVLGAAAERLSAAALRRRIPGLAANLGLGLFTPEDWRIEPRAALAALHAAALAAGVRFAARSVRGFAPGAAALSDGEKAPADLLILATGAEGSDLAPELAVLSPIKGQILRYAGVRADDDRPVLRCRGGYAVPARDGLRVGATMEPGLADRRVDPALAAPLGRFAAELFPGLQDATHAIQAGVRAATPDGLPLVGASARPGVWLATGARRNGWLLAPLVARMLAAYLSDRDPGPYAGLVAPRRFASS
ncbi:MAG TPA: FAD-dependent oxidoreductase [Caulobacteraceae bacterium]|jgi:glycine oxidase